MTVKEMYDSLGENYIAVFDRIGDDVWIAKYLKKFASDDSIEKIKDAMKKEDYESCFEISHNLKGVALNLGLGHLSDSTSIFCDEMRDFNPGPFAEGLYEKMKTDFEEAVNMINSLE